MEKSEPIGREIRCLCQRDLFPALTGHLFSGGQMDFLPLEAQFPASSKKTECYFNSI